MNLYPSWELDQILMSSYGSRINEEKLFNITTECSEMILEIDELKPNTTYRCRLKTVTLFGESSLLQGNDFALLQQTFISSIF